MKELIGMHIESIWISDDSDVLLFIDKRPSNPPIAYSCVGDCCAACYIATFNGIDYLMNAMPTAVISKSTTMLNEDYDNEDVSETWGYTITTHKGTADIEMRVDHNGYYSGTCEKVDILSMKKLKDEDRIVLNLGGVDFLSSDTELTVKPLKKDF
jgi:hypothetical protein